MFEKKLEENPTLCNNIVTGEVFQKYVKQILTIAAKAVENSFGPNGTHTTFERAGKADCSRDGVTILKAIMFDGSMETAIYNYLIESSNRLNVLVGDGTTSAFLATERLYTHISKLVKENDTFKALRPKDVYDIVTEVAQQLVAVISKTSKKFEDIEKYEDKIAKIYDIAKISLNHDLELAGIFKSIYEKVGLEGDVVIDMSNDPNHAVVYSDGYKYHYGYYSPLLINNSIEQTVSLQSADVMMFAGIPNNPDHEALIRKVIEKYSLSNKPLVLIASGFSHRIQKYFDTYFSNRGQIINNCINIIEMPTEGKNANNTFIDFVKLFGADAISVETTILPGLDANTDEEYYAIDVKERIDRAIEHITTKMVGRTDVVSGQDYTIFRNTKGEGTELVASRITSIQIDIARLSAEKTIDHSLDLNALNKRLARLSKSLVTLYVGGDTYAAKVANRDLAIDSSKAIKAFITSGYNIGCNLAVPLACKKFIDLVETNFKNNVEPKTSPEELESVHKEMQATIDITRAISEAFLDLYRIILKGVVKDNDIQTIIDSSLLHGVGFNTIDMEYDPSIINPAITDIQVLTTAIEVVLMLLTSNQFILASSSSNTYDDVRYVDEQ